MLRNTSWTQRKNIKLKADKFTWGQQDIVIIYILPSHKPDASFHLQVRGLDAADDVPAASRLTAHSHSSTEGPLPVEHSSSGCALLLSVCSCCVPVLCQSRLFFSFSVDLMHQLIFCRALAPLHYFTFSCISVQSNMCVCLLSVLLSRHLVCCHNTTLTNNSLHSFHIHQS